MKWMKRIGMMASQENVRDGYWSRYAPELRPDFDELEFDELVDHC